MRILLLGNTGQLGYEAERALACLGEVSAFDYPEIDFTRPESLASLVDRVQPQVIFNAVAYTAVDRAELELEKARVVNAITPGVLAEAARKHSAVLVHFSTDYVFDGKKNAPYTEEDETHPLNVYGQTKLEGEQAVAQAGDAFLTFRTTWVYSNRRDSFVNKVLQWSRKQTSLKVVDDQISGPTWARALAEITALVLARGGAELTDWVRERRGLYHLCGEGSTSRYEWAKEILANDLHAQEQLVQEILPVKSDAFPTPAERPLYSVLDCAKFKRTFDMQLPAWQKALKWAMQG